eukprot:scaffold4811_cov171-Cylindrotheca_fusiformis.AAC.4
MPISLATHYLPNDSTVLAVFHIGMAARRGTSAAAAGHFRADSIRFHRCWLETTRSASPNDHLRFSNTLPVVPSCKRAAEHSIST